MPLPTRTKVICCHWVFVIKFNPYGSAARLKARFVVKVMLRLMELIILIHFLL